MTDRSWVAAYVKNVTPMVERHGGRYLARTTTIQKLEGERKAPWMFLIIAWPSKEAVETFYNSEEYRPYLERRKAGSKGEFLLIAGEDINQAARTSG
ncbi:MAG: DUF1330 domain-containing protein [Acidobacteriia bacterium]|nr:DUF1330 domain-containing protein [Terriglobia bacterium]